jgi:hypothetical protein
MKTQVVLLISIVIGFAGCDKSKNTNTGIPESAYFGTFQRIATSGDAMVSNVMISLVEGKWSGQTDIEKYPALCRGSYEIKNGKVIFTNECAWTADFDWSLILSGEYEYSYNDSSLTIIKNYNNQGTGHIKDIYTLSLPKSGIKKSPVTGTWVETVTKTDTMVFSPEYDGQFPIFILNRATRVIEGYTLPGYFSGPYWYITGANSISIQWFLSSTTAFNRFYFEFSAGGNEFKILNFFTDPMSTAERDTLTFTRIVTK